MHGGVAGCTDQNDCNIVHQLHVPGSSDGASFCCAVAGSDLESRTKESRPALTESSSVLENSQACLDVARKHVDGALMIATDRSQCHNFMCALIQLKLFEGPCFKDNKKRMALLHKVNYIFSGCFTRRLLRTCPCPVAPGNGLAPGEAGHHPQGAARACGGTCVGCHPAALRQIDSFYPSLRLYLCTLRHAATCCAPRFVEYGWPGACLRKQA